MKIRMTARALDFSDVGHGLGHVKDLIKVTHVTNLSQFPQSKFGPSLVFHSPKNFRH